MCILIERSVFDLKKKNTVFIQTNYKTSHPIGKLNAYIHWDHFLMYE